MFEEGSAVWEHRGEEEGSGGGAQAVRGGGADFDGGGGIYP